MNSCHKQILSKNTSSEQGNKCCLLNQKRPPLPPTPHGCLGWTSAALDCVRLWPLCDPHPARTQLEKQAPQQHYCSDSKVAQSKPPLTSFSSDFTCPGLCPSWPGASGAICQPVLGTTPLCKAQPGLWGVPHPSLRPPSSAHGPAFLGDAVLWRGRGAHPCCHSYFWRRPPA